MNTICEWSFYIFPTLSLSPLNTINKFFTEIDTVKFLFQTSRISSSTLHFVLYLNAFRTDNCSPWWSTIKALSFPSRTTWWLVEKRVCTRQDWLHLRRKSPNFTLFMAWPTSNKLSKMRWWLFSMGSTFMVADFILVKPSSRSWKL